MALGTKRKAANTLSKQPLDLPPATVHAYAGTTAPEGWAVCDGSEVSRTTYAALFAVVGTIYGVGDGSTTFNLPDYRGYFLRGQDDGAGNDPDAGTRTGGDTVGSTQTDQLKSHEHLMIAGQAFGGNSTATWLGEDHLAQNGSIGDSFYRLRGTSTDPDAAKTSLTGGSEARPVNIAVKYIIKL